MVDLNGFRTEQKQHSGISAQLDELQNLNIEL